VDFVAAFAVGLEQLYCCTLYIAVSLSVKKPQRNYRANSYVIPSDKKRKTLRWQIRADLAQGVKPPSVFD